MIFRITDYVHYGTLDNRKRGTVHLTLQLMGMPHPVNITLHGDCLQEKEDAADYCTMAARMALCVEQTRRTVAALDNCGYQMDGEIAERFSSLLEEVNSFQESLATQSRKSNL